MNLGLALTAMLPEHLLLLGIVALLVLEIASPDPRGAFAVALAATVAAAGAALWLHASGFAGMPFPGHYTVGPAISLAKYKLCPLCGRWGLSILLYEKLGTILLVRIPFSAFGPWIPRNSSASK